MVSRIVAFASFLVASGLPARLDAHPLHSSYAEITRDRTGAIVTNVRLFADDFGALLDSLRSSSGGHSIEPIAQRYVQRQLVLLNPDGHAIPTVWCGMRAEHNVVWVCARTAGPVVGAFRVRNALMFDRFGDQISIIRWTGKTRRTLVLSAHVPEARLE